MLVIQKDERFNLPHIHHGFTTRQGGVSTGDFSSLNLSYKDKWDNHHNVTENRGRLANWLSITPNQLLFLKQVHGSDIHIITNNIDTQSNNLVGDAMICFDPKVVIGVLSADCAPILMAHKKEKIVAAIHAGWRGAAANIIKNVAKKLQWLNLDPKDFVCSIGPCIHQSNFEVGHDVYTSFQKGEELFFLPIPISRLSPSLKYQLDLPGLIKAQLLGAGFITVFESLWDTYSNPELFFSCRYAAHHGHQSFGCGGSFIGAIS